MTACNHVLLFSDEHRDLLGEVRDLNVRSRTSPRLRTFLNAASVLVHEQALVLDDIEGARFGTFEDLVDLAEQHVRQHCPSVVVEIALFTTIQIGQLVVFIEEHTSTLWTRTGEVSMPVGFGLGLIAAAVAAAASTLDAVVTLGLEGVAIAFRLAIDLQRKGRDIEDSNGIWTRLVSGLNQEELNQRLEEFNDTIQPLHRAYIGQVLPGSIVVLGPPSTLDALTQTPEFAQITVSSHASFRCPMYGSHLPSVDVTQILGDSPVLACTVQRSLYSAHSSGGPLTARQFYELLRFAVLGITHRPMQIMETLQTVAAALQETDKTDVVLRTFGSTRDAAIVQRVFQQHEQNVHFHEFSPRPQYFGNKVSGTFPGEIAVVGMSGRFPESDTLNEFWSILETGKTTHQEICPSRFCVDDFYDPSRSKHNALFARHGCFIKNPGDFDHRLFNISPREALQMDPVQRMLLMTTYEALEMAGYAPSNTADGKQVPPRIATYFGQTTDDWKTINEQHGIDTHFLPGINRGFGPGRLCHYFKWAGGFYSIDTGCSSSATGVCIARDALAAGECDAAVVGGGTLLKTPEWFAGLSQGGFLSPTGACKTYSDSADGYCRGEGVGVVVLKRLADAARAKDNVLAVISGAARNCNAGAGSITYPSEQAQEALYRRVLRQAAVRPHEVGFVEMHGTGTQAGDRVETNAVRSVFASPTEPKRTQPLLIGAVKANIGHSEAAAGIMSLIKSILMLRYNTIPPQPNQPFTLNPHLTPLLGTDIQLANGQAWPRNGTVPRHIFVNNFDAAGGNVSLLLREPPSFVLQQPLSQADDRAYHVVVTSGRTNTAHDANKSRLRQYLIENPDTQLADLAYTTTARRMHHAHRDAYVTTSIAKLQQQLEQPAPTQAVTPSVVFAFTGQGSQYVGMGGILYNTSPKFQRLLDSYQRLCDAHGLSCQFLNIICGSEDATSKDPMITGREIQVANVALEIALARYWQSLGLRPTLLIGHSLGEYAALCVAGVLSVVDALALAHERATLIFTRCRLSESGMLAVSLPASAVQYRICSSPAMAGCEVSCLNSPSSTVVSGTVPAIEALEDELKSNGNVAVTRLPVKHAFHSRQMDDVLADFESIASRVTFHPPKLAVASALLGRVVSPGEGIVFNARYLRRHTREPVAFLRAVQACETEGLIRNQSFVVEVGPHPTCIGFIASSLREVKPSSFPSLRRSSNDWESISQCLAAAYRAQLHVDWAEFHKEHLDHLRLIKDLPTYAFDKKSFWLPYKSNAVPHNMSDAILRTSSSPVSRISTSLHSIEQLRKEGDRLLATFMADVSDHHLAEAIGGHVVDGMAICPASIFIDMAYTAAAYLEKGSHNVQSAFLATYELNGLSMQNPLVLRREVDERPRVSVEGALEKGTNVVSVRFSSRREGVDSSPVEHGSCLVHIGQSETSGTQTWSQMQPLVKARIRTLDASSSPKEVYAMDLHLFYKIFSEIVDYSTPYQAVEEAIIAVDFRDAAITLKSAPAMEYGIFTCNPFAVDALVHVAGFLLNADVRKPANEVHIANHIGSLRVLGDLSSCQRYRAYATIREQDAKAGRSLCDVYVTDSHGKLVALCTDICFKKLERDFFALLTGAARALPSKLSSRISPRRDWQQEKPAESSSSSVTSTSETPLLSSRTSLSETVDIFGELLDAIAARIGISVDEVKKSSGTTFAEMGVDSQMSIAILANFQKTTAVELPAAFFTSFPTLAAVERELGSSQPGNITDNRKTPGDGSRGSCRRQSNRRRLPLMEPSKHLFRLVTNALGLEVSDLTPSTTFESIGMDSMLSIKVMAAFKKETEIELPAAFFTNHRTISDAREELDGPLETKMENKQQSTSPVKRLDLSVALAAKNMSQSTRQHKIGRAVSRAVLIQGHYRSTSAPLFLATDGSGTVESYIHLHALPEDRRIYALESPFLESPEEEFDVSIEEMASIFIRTICKIQPHGPYLIGGWSAGSIYAYEVAYRLTMQGETISGLVILDMRAPSTIRTAIITPDFLNKIGTFEGINRARNLPEDLSAKEKAHLLATCRALSRYSAPAFPVDRQPRQIAVVWARLGLDDRKDAPLAAMSRPDLINGKPLNEITLSEFEHYFNSWFYGRREQFGTNGWETLLGDYISVHSVDGGSFITPHICREKPAANVCPYRSFLDDVAAVF
ncbi:MAG: hypothetical protein Q9160_004703 [Pyrenula sp. 1 TL-2023]